MAADLIANSGQIILGMVFGGVALVMLIESIAPLRAVPQAPLGRWINNLALTVVDYTLLFGLIPLTSILIAKTIGLGNNGLLHRLDVGYFVSFILTLLCLELLGYWLHRALHSVPMLWRIHTVHHCDVEMDATTSHRHHPLEIVISTLATVPILLLLGPDPLVLLAYNMLHTAMGALTHGNYTLGQPVDRVLRRFLVTPDFHRLHHSAEQRYTDSNYASILPMFDYLFRTATHLPVEQHKTITMGLEYFREKKYARLDQLLLIPFLPKFSEPAVPAR